MLNGGHLHAAALAVADVEYALGADQLHMGVIAVLHIGCAVDHELNAVFEGAGHHDGVIVIRIFFAGFGIAVVACDGVEAGDVAAGEPAAGVDIVGIDLGQDAVGLLDIIHPRTGLGRAAGVGVDLNQIADGAAVQHFLGLLEALVMTAHEADLELDVVALAGFDHLFTFFHVHGHGLFAEDMLAGVGAVDHDAHVQVGGGNDDHCIHLGIGEDCMVIGEILGAAQFLGGSLCGGFDDVYTCNHFGALDLIDVVARMDHTGTAAADQADAQNLLTHGKKPLSHIWNGSFWCKCALLRASGASFPSIIARMACECNLFLAFADVIYRILLLFW